MSIDYFLFVRTDDIGEIRATIAQVEGVTFDGDTLEIDGLFCVNCRELDPHHRELMLHEYGDYGLDVNWLIRGTRDKEADLLELMDRLFRCAAAIVNAHPDAPLSLMCNGEFFYVFNTIGRLLVCPHWVNVIPAVTSLFERQVTVKDMIYE